MILVDANILIYAHVSSFPQHHAAREWLDEKLNGTAPVGLPWPSLLGFVRIVSNPRIFESPESVNEAWHRVEAWLDCSPVWIPLPSERHRHILAPLLAGHTPKANLVPDAHLAALALEHGLILCSTDHDFSRFPDLKWENPIH